MFPNKSNQIKRNLQKSLYPLCNAERTENLFIDLKHFGFSLMTELK